MYFAGVDLAWSARNGSGIAVVDGAGALVHSAVTGTDEQILEALAPYRDGLTVVALDAPLVVPNAAGGRRAEIELSAAYARWHAGAYRTNRSLPWMDPPRAETLAHRAGWRIGTDRPAPHDARPVQAPTALEVYPHPAMVALFGLDRVLPYKARAHRTVASRKVAFEHFAAHVEALGPLALPAHPRWEHLCSALRTAVRPVELKRLEDEFDAILCPSGLVVGHRQPGAPRLGQRRGGVHRRSFRAATAVTRARPARRRGPDGPMTEARTEP